MSDTSQTAEELLSAIRDVVSQDPGAEPRAPLVLGPAARIVDAGAIEAGRSDPAAASDTLAPAVHVPPSPMFEEEELRRLVSEIVHEELEGLIEHRLGHDLDDRIRTLLRVELSAMLERAGQAIHHPAADPEI